MSSRRRAVPGRFAKPAAGDLVLTCSHTDAPGTLHWWHAPKGIEFRRPDRTVGEAHWIVSCAGCYLASGGDALKVQVTSDSTWGPDERPVPMLDRSSQ